MPWWPERLQLVHARMDAFPEAVHVGWDLAIGEQGPLVIQAGARSVGVKRYQLHRPFTDDPEVYAFCTSYGLLP